MNIDNFISSTLKIVASENLNIEQDLSNTSNKNINELLNEKEGQTPKEQQNEKNEQS
jgi:hypothetical protein